MAKYIELEAVEKFIENGLNNPDKKKAFGHDAIEIMAEVHYMPAADVAPVVHGHWVEQTVCICNSDGKPIAPIDIEYVCSVCGRKEDYREPYCNCGAKMDRGSHE